MMINDRVETFRGTMQGRTPEGDNATVIVLRRGEGSDGRVWLTFNGAIKTTVVMTNPETKDWSDYSAMPRGHPVNAPRRDTILVGAGRAVTRMPAKDSRKVQSCRKHVGRSFSFGGVIPQTPPTGDKNSSYGE